AVGHPDIFDLMRVLQKPAAFALLGVRPFYGAASVGPHLLEIARRQSLGRRAKRIVTAAPDGVEIVVFGKDFQQFGRSSSDKIYDAARQIAGFKNLIKIARDERVFLGRNRNHSVSGRNQRQGEREKSEER